MSRGGPNAKRGVEPFLRDWGGLEALRLEVAARGSEVFDHQIEGCGTCTSVLGRQQDEMRPTAQFQHRDLIAVLDLAHTQLEHEPARGLQVGGPERNVPDPDGRSKILFRHGFPVFYPGPAPAGRGPARRQAEARHSAITTSEETPNAEKDSW